MPNVLKEAIIKTIAFFNIFSFPLTSFEIWKFMYVGSDKKNPPDPSPKRLAFSRAGLYTKRVIQESPLHKGDKGGFASLTEVRKILDSGELNYAIEEKNGFYFLHGRENIIKTRMERHNHTDRKFKRALRMAKIFAFIPWIKMIAVANIIGPHNLRNSSDIDLFIITEKKRIWLARFFTAAVTQLLGLRPKKNDIRDKICLSFFISEEAKNLKRLTLNGKEDIYFIYWLAGLTPLYDQNESYVELIKANSWINKYLPNWRLADIVKRGRVELRFPRLFGALVDIVFGRFERHFKKLQIKLIPPNMKAIANKDTRVVINDKVIKLHINDRRETYREMFEEAVE
ncbi:hypothetical protein HY798_03445 [Candidatus Falkowbacteria bacterium]|nr:hypothetical protein [Candidatus Falkowbacteria bacterium]